MRASRVEEEGWTGVKAHSPSKKLEAKACGLGLSAKPGIPLPFSVQTVRNMEGSETQFGNAHLSESTVSEG